ncbi:MAG: DUF2344 domain-containing protein [Eubacterium sp.]|nr:DUF2344 domain-containing protein [Eubacterium sp.]
MREVRIRFAKTDRAKYISHLDINRVFQRAFARAEINLWFTEGFNPHPYMSFSLPLSLGVESLCENVDIRLNDDLSDIELKDRLNSVLPEGIKVIDVYDDFMDSSKIVYSDYVFKLEFKDNKAALDKLNSVLSSDEILALKKGKQGKRRVLKETDIKQFIVSYNSSIRGEQIVINFRLLAGPEKNLNPSLLFDTLIRLIDTDYEWKSISRINLLTADLSEYK